MYSGRKKKHRITLFALGKFMFEWTCWNFQGKHQNNKYSIQAGRGKKEYVVQYSNPMLDRKEEKLIQM